MNRLATESSPYLLQHRENPVDWYAWSEEAFEAARTRDVPVFLSIGYATCHWCHVMAHESFEDDEVADLLNEHFVSIKVDREERPDIDQIYMSVCQIMGGSCGWPLTVVMTPDARPFFVATYIPKRSRFGRMGMMDLVPRLAHAWREDRARVEESAESLTSAVRRIDLAVTGPSEVDSEWLRLAFVQLAERYDPEFGGFGGAPKFPTPHNLLFLLRYAHREREESALRIVTQTLRSMRKGGIFDQLGYGFHRYSTDREWKLPHFEKMLYDQALLIMVYVEAFLVTGDAFFRDVACEVAEYVLRDMTSPAGGFYSAEDADSEGVEGKFYVWSVDELRRALPQDLAELVEAHYGVVEEGNFLEEATRELTGVNVLYPYRSAQPDDPADVERLERARRLLFERREERPRPLRDDKILTDWNGLMIAALAGLGRSTGEERYLRAAIRAAEFIADELTDDRGNLLHRHREGLSGIRPGLHDHASLTWGLIELYLATHDPAYLGRAIETANAMIELHWDDAGGGFYMTPEGGEQLVARLKDFDDGAMPSGNAVALHCLLRLSRLTGDARFDEMSARLLEAAAPRIDRYPSGYTGLLIGLEFLEAGPMEVVVVGSRGSEPANAMMDELRTRYLPSSVSLRVDEESYALERYAPFAAAFAAPEEGALAYVCRDHVCGRPSRSPAEMVEALQAAFEDSVNTKRIDAGAG